MMSWWNEDRRIRRYKFVVDPARGRFAFRLAARCVLWAATDVTSFAFDLLRGRPPGLIRVVSDLIVKRIGVVLGALRLHGNSEPH